MAFEPHLRVGEGPCFQEAKLLRHPLSQQKLATFYTGVGLPLRDAGNHKSQPWQGRPGLSACKQLHRNQLKEVICRREHQRDSLCPMKPSWSPWVVLTPPFQSCSPRSVLHCCGWAGTEALEERSCISAFDMKNFIVYSASPA